MRAWPRCPRHTLLPCWPKLRPSLLGTRCRRLSSRTRSIRELLQSEANNETATVNGFVKSIRKQKRIAFAEITDGSCLKPVQAVLTPEQADPISNGAAVRLRGSYVPSPEGKEQSSELRVDQVQCLGANDADAYPIQNKYQTAEFLRTLPHLRVRTTRNALLLRLRSQMIAQATQFFQEQGYTQTHTPIITSSDCEGAGEVFEVKGGASHSSDVPQDKALQHSFFESPKYLTVSAQLHLEALAHSVGKVWTLSPAFRAETSDTNRHLSEFQMLEAELCFTECLEDVMSVVEGLIKMLVRGVGTTTIGQELSSTLSQTHAGTEADGRNHLLASRWDSLLRKQWPRVTYHAATEILRSATDNGLVQFSTPVDAASGLHAEHERYLAETVGDWGPIFVTDYPKAIKPFYMAPSEELASEPTVACFDLLLPEVCEVAGGSLREHRLEPLRAIMRERGLLAMGQGSAAKRGSMDWYLDLRRYGGAPHGGFGLGFDRLVGYIAGAPNIRDIVAFPRWHGRCDC